MPLVAVYCECRAIWVETVPPAVLNSARIDERGQDKCERRRQCYRNRANRDIERSNYVATFGRHEEYKTRNDNEISAEQLQGKRGVRRHHTYRDKAITEKQMVKI